ncbi:DUF2254 domain-containing protein [Mycolicibacterium sediminis]|uniref:DUF2254 domain-containing protein n=1 Tax=Mycolicibacterium sediminis TaxID=1286180 RepID=A0A7I7R0F6_9MYCO|nr:DUF2254 domain-containing protein [Mycolicibacterium sediminis]BBY31626.1 hypothetical protein MSEDJ_57220 [Mycolicibacterium sediminis]
MTLTSAVDRGRTRLLDAVRTRLWPLPSVSIAVAIVAGVALPELDARIDGSLPDVVAGFLFGGGAGAAREVLGAIASSVMTVTSLTFSLTLVTLQLASGQFSPRLLRTFVGDAVVHRTLGLFLATFTYALTVLRTVRDADDDGSVFVPQISVTVAYLLAVVSVVVLVLFLAHLVRQIRVETMLGSILADSSKILDEVSEEDVPRLADAPRPPDGATTVLATRTGFVTGVDPRRLVRAAEQAGAVVQVARRPGDWLVRDTPVAFVWPSGTGLADDVADRMRDCIATTVHIGDERTPVDDIGYGVRQLTDVVTKALSPGVNDPTTAVHGIGFLSALLSRLARQRLGCAEHRDGDGVLRVLVPGPSFGELLDEAVSGPRHYGRTDAAVSTALTRLLRDVAWCAGDGHGDAISSQLTRLRRTIAAQDFDDVERADLGRSTRAVEDALSGHWRDPTSEGVV